MLTCHVLKASCSVAQLKTEMLQVGECTDTLNALASDQLTPMHVQNSQSSESCRTCQVSQSLQG